MASKQVARYAVTFGLSGCYMPDAHGGAHEFTTRRDLAEFIKYELQAYDMPASLFAEANIRRTWSFIKRHGSSTAHFAIHHGANVLEFHGLTEEEFTSQNVDD